MIETLYAPQNKNIARQTKSDKIYLNVQKKVKEIVLKELKRKQLKNFNKRNKIRVFCVFSGDLFLVQIQTAQETEQDEKMVEVKSGLESEEDDQLILYYNNTVINHFDNRTNFLKEIARLE